MPRPSEPAKARWVPGIVDPACEPAPSAPLIGVLTGEGIGREVVTAALDVLTSLEEAGGGTVRIEMGGPIGYPAVSSTGAALPDEVATFCDDVFARGGAILTGPGGGRYVYDLRRRLELYLKLVPVSSRLGLPETSPLRSDSVRDLDLLLVRENLGGIYQGRSEESFDASGRRVIRHHFETSEAGLHRFLGAAARLAAERRGRLTVVVKQGGMPSLADLWRATGLEASATAGVDCNFVDVDLMAYELIRRPSDFDVIAASNLAGDILSDLTAVLVGSRALSFSGNFSPRGHAAYQTNHGAAHDIAGTDTANPVGQILSLAMLLRESLGLGREAAAIEDAVRLVWASGVRTADIATRDDHAVGTREMAGLIAESAATQLGTLTQAA